jgi:hypothetical protein
VVAVLALVVAVGGVAAGAIPDNGVIHGCYDNAAGRHALYVRDTSEACQGGQTSLDWNQQGAQGPEGPQGAQGQQGLAGSSGGGLIHLGPLSKVGPRKTKKSGVQLADVLRVSYTTNNHDIACATGPHLAHDSDNPDPLGYCAKTAIIACPNSRPVFVGHDYKVVRGSIPAAVDVVEQSWHVPGNPPTDWQVTAFDSTHLMQPSQVKDSPLPHTLTATGSGWGWTGFFIQSPASLAGVPLLANWDIKVEAYCAKAK